MNPDRLGKMRPLNIARDLDGFGKLIEIAFSGELSRRGTDIRQELNSVRRLVPIIKTLGWVSESFRHLIDGYVCENAGRIVGSVIVQRMGNDPTRWYIGAVAVHPDYRRCGIARRLLEEAIEHARTHGAKVCVLDVRTDNTPARALYRSLGFVPYAGMSELKLGRIPDSLDPSLPLGYSIRPWKLSEWRISYELARAETPPRAQEFLPVKEREYRITSLQRTVSPFLMRMQGIDPHRYLVVHGGKPVATLRLLAQRRNKGTHELRIQFDPAHREAVAAPLIARALSDLASYPPRNTIVMVHSDFNDLIAILETYGFAPIEHTHRLGLRLAS